MASGTSENIGNLKILMAESFLKMKVLVVTVKASNLYFEHFKFLNKSYSKFQ